MTQYHSNFNGETVPFSDMTAQISLATNVAQTYTVPGNATQKYRAEFSYLTTANVFIGFNVTATVPASGTTDTTNNIEFRPHYRFVFGGNTLSLVTPDALGNYVGVSLLAIPG